MARGTQEGTRFVAKYEDGNTASFEVDKYTLKRGDHVARIIAGEKQGDGSLPLGKILSVERER